MKALAFGEILFDVYSDRKCLGGAPLNVAGHLARLGFESSIVSAVGSDGDGNEARSLVSSLGVRTDYIQTVSGIPTGRTEIVLDNGIPSYEFNSPCAWDEIRPSPDAIGRIFAETWDVFCFGTLAARSPTSRQTLTDLVSGVRAKTVFFDVNLRKRFYDADILKYGLSKSDILKMNDEEVPVLARLLEAPAGMDDDHFQDWLIGEWGLSGVLLTKGKAGASARFGGKTSMVLPGTVPVVDTVGAGDSFSAAFLASLARGYTPEQALVFASTLADYVVTQNGAIPEYSLDIRSRLSPLF